MTVIVGVKCPDGAVLATDSQGTFQMGGGPPVKQYARKIETLGKHIAYAGTGGQGAGQRIHAALDKHASKMGSGKSASDTVDLIRATVNPLQQQIRGEWVNLPNTQPEMWGGIFCGWAKDGPWLFEMDPSGASQFHDRIVSTGSAYPLAYTALLGVSHLEVEQQSIDGLKAIAYRAIENACTSSAYGVGMPVQIAVVTNDGVEEMYEGDDVHTELKELIDLWKAQEVEALGSLAPKAATEEPPVVEGTPEEPTIDESEIQQPSEK